MESATRAPAQKVPADALLEARDISAVLAGDDGDVLVLDNVTLAVAEGEIVDVGGPSGAGKTTLLRALARLLPESTGSLLLRRQAADEIAPSEWRSKVALLPQKPAIVPGSVRQNLVLPWRLRVRVDAAPPDDATLLRALADVGLGQVSLDREASRMSVGQQARVALLRVVLAKPWVLLLDEPDAALDDASAEQVAVMTAGFAASGGGVVRVRHQRSDELATRRLRLSGGLLEEVGA
jgi:putative ABC transport system ATP-binding protein